MVEETWGWYLTHLYKQSFLCIFYTLMMFKFPWFVFCLYCKQIPIKPAMIHVVLVYSPGHLITDVGLF